MVVGIQERAQMGQTDVAGGPGDRVEHDANACLLRVCLDVIDTFLDALVRSLFVLCYVMLVHPLLVIPLVLHLVFENIVLVLQPLPLASAVSELYVHTSHGEESTEHLNEDPRRAPALSLLGSLCKAWWRRFVHRVHDRQELGSFSRSTVRNIFAFFDRIDRIINNNCVSYLFEYYEYYEPN